MKKRVMIDNSQTDVTKTKKFDFIRSFVETGQQPDYLYYCNDTYDFEEVQGDKYVYHNKDTNYDIFVALPMNYIDIAKQLFERILKF